MDDKIQGKLRDTGWNVGKIIKTQILGDNKPEYGKSVIQNLSKELVLEYGCGYSQRNLFNMVELMKLDEARIHVAEVITRTLAQKLPEAIDNAKHFWNNVNCIRKMNNMPTS